MTSLQSLLARFRKSATNTRRKKRSRLDRSQPANVEHLEDRLLLVNPVALSSLPGAEVTVYLDFDGDTEGTVAWTQIRQDGLTGSIDTPVFSFDGNDAFSQAEIDSITEIFHRVAEDFRPFDINVTTVDPASIGAGRELEVVVGGDGSWRLNNDRYAALIDSFDDATISQKAFVFQTRHNGLGGTFEQNIAASISSATAISMGLRDRTLEGDILIAPILGDQIVGLDTNLANLNSERDIWFDAPTSAGTQDDLDVLDQADNVDYREDDVGNTDATSTGLDTIVGTETVTGVIEQNTDVDVFAIATAATNATITVSTLDVRNQFPGNRKTPGSNLDPTLTIRDINGTVIASADDAGLNTTVSTSLQAGTYFIEVSNGGEYGNLGEYTLTIDGIDQLPSYANPVSLNSNPGAPVDLYLGFAGGQIRQGSDLLTNRSDGALGTLNLTPYDTDGDFTSFSQQEINEISEIWARVAEDFRPFNVNITTVDPGTLVDEQSAEVLIGGSEFVMTPSQVSYTALSNAFTGDTLENTGLVFSADMPTAGTQYSLQQEVATFASATFGTMFGLEPRVLFNGSSTQVIGDAETAPIMGAPRNALRDTWSLGASPTTTQDSLALITDDLTNSIDYREDDHSDLLTSATVIPVGPGTERLTGIIEQNSDIDLFRFDTLATTATIDVTGLNLTTQFLGVTNPGSNLDPVLELLDINGDVIASDDIPFNLTNGNRALTANLTEQLGAGTYYIRVTTDGDYGNLGEYTVTLQGVDVVPVSVTIDPDTFAETDDLQVGVGTVGRPAGQIGSSDLVIDLFSQDPSEVLVQSQVTIPAGAVTASFDISLVDDTLLDGDQRVEIRAQVGGVDNGGTVITVTDVETIELSVAPDPVAENSGTASLTVRRSNTDVDAPNHWVVSGNNLLEYSPEGALVSTVPVEWFNGDPRPPGQNVHDVVIMENGRIAVFNGTSTAGLSVYTPEIDVWEHFGPIDGLTADGSNSSSGGLSTTGDFVFLTDQETFVGDLHGMIRVNVANGEIDRFGEGTVGARLFAMATTRTSTIHEFDPIDGSLINTLLLPLVPGSVSRYSAEAIAFDGTDLWVLSRQFTGSSFHQLIRVNANTGDLLEVHPMGIFPNDIFLEGLAELDGTLYLSSTIGVGGVFGAQIQAYDPARRLPVGGTLAVEAVNGIFVEDIIGSLPQSNRLLVVDNFSDVIHQVDPNTGVSLGSFAAAPGRAFEFFEPGITSVGDVIFGGVNYDELIYIEAENFFQPTTEIDLYTTTGSRIDTDTSTPEIDPLTTELAFSGDLAGNDVPGVTTSDLQFRDVTISLDGRLYGLLDSGDEISIHDPNTLLRIGGITLDQSVNTITVGDNSGIFAGNDSGEIIRFNFSGTTEVTASTNLVVINDIEANIGQEVIVADAAGNVLITDQDAIENGDVSTTPPLENTGGSAFATFGRHKTRTTGNLVVTLASDDLTELQVPPTVTIPEGEQEITISVSVIDDNERDGDQSVTIHGDSLEHMPGSVSVTVADYEAVTVDVVPDAVSEDAGIVLGAVDGGTYSSTNSISAASSNQVAIVDQSRTTSQIEVVASESRITDINVSLSLDHQEISDLDVYLVSPTGIRVRLFSDLGPGAGTLTDAIFDDQVPTIIGHFLPEQSLSILHDESPSGTWSLEVIDDTSSNVGTLLNWGMEIQTVSGAIVISRSDVDGPYDFADSVSVGVDDAVSILDDNVIISEVVVPSQVSSIADVNVSLSIEHEAIPDLDVYLISPSGTRVELFTDLSTNENTLTGTILDDEAATAIIDGDSPYTGRFLPEESLSILDGENPSGTWLLEVIDDNATDIGRLLNWNLEIETIGLSPLTVNISSDDTTEAFPVLESTFDSIGTIAIEDGMTATSQIEVPAELSNANFSHVDLSLTLAHNDLSDLEVVLISPAGSRVQLFADVGKDITALTAAVFDDEAPNSIANVIASGSGRYRPLESLSSLSGENPSGTWTLEVTDKTNSAAEGEDPATVGAIQDWQISLFTLPRTNEIVIPANQAQVVIPLETIGDDILDGTQTVGINVVSALVTDSHGAFQLEGDVVDVTDAEQIVITVNSVELSEGDNNPATVATITRSDTATATDLVVSLSSSDLTELSVPQTVTIPANQSSATFNVSVVDDLLFDGDQTVTISASAPGFLTSQSEPITVKDAEPRLMLSTVTPTVTEDAGTITFTLAREDVNDLSVPQEVTLSTSDSSEISLPSTSVTIPAGEFSTSFTATVVDDTLLDGSQMVLITAVDADTNNKVVNDASLEVTVDDAEFVTLTVTDGSSVFSEAGGEGVAEVTVTLSSAEHDLPVFVSLENGDVTEVAIPETVIIPANTSSATFFINAVDDVLIDSNQSVQLTAKLDGFNSGTLDLTVTDYEPPILTGPTVVTEDPTPSIAWAPLTGAVRYDLWVNDISRDITQLFRHENRDGGISALEDDFESSAFDPAVWDAVDSVEIDALAENDPSGSVSAHFDGSGARGIDLLDSATIDLAGRAGVQLTYSFQKSTSLAPLPEGEDDTNRDDVVIPGHDLVFSYRNTDGFWIQFDIQSSLQPNITHFETVRIDLPEEALHSEFALRIESFGVEEPEDGGEAPVDRTDWFLDYVEITEHQSFTPEQELGVGRYRAWVRGFDSLNRPTAWSRGMDFRIVTRPEFVTPTNQSFLSTAAFPEISWTSVVDTTYYDLWINNVTTGESQVVRETELPTTSYASELAELDGGAYRAWTRASVVDVPRTEAARAQALIADPDLTPAELAEIEELVYGRWSAPVNFTVLSTPTILTPGGATFIRRPEITWTEVEGASNYYVWLARRTSGEDPEVILRDRFVTDTTRVPDADLTDGTYVVWVQAISADGTPSRWSAAQTFSVNGNVTVLTPQNSDIVSATPTFQWTAITGTERYEVWVNRVDVPEHQSAYSDDVRGTSFTVDTPLVSGATYRLWVRAVSEMGEFSFWSFPTTFSVAAVESPLVPAETLVAFTRETTQTGPMEPAGREVTQAQVASHLSHEVPEAELPTVVSVQEGEATIESVEIDSVMEEFAVADWSLELPAQQEDRTEASAAGIALGLVASSSLLSRRRDDRKRS